MTPDELRRHLPGQHNQKTHGNRFKSPGVKSSGYRHLASKLHGHDLADHADGKHDHAIAAEAKKTAAAAKKAAAAKRTAAPAEKAAEKAAVKPAAASAKFAPGDGPTAALSAGADHPTWGHSEEIRATLRQLAADVKAGRMHGGQAADRLEAMADDRTRLAKNRVHLRALAHTVRKERELQKARDSREEAPDLDGELSPAVMHQGIERPAGWLDAAELSVRKSRGKWDVVGAPGQSFGTKREAEAFILNAAKTRRDWVDGERRTENARLKNGRELVGPADLRPGDVYIDHPTNGKRRTVTKVDALESGATMVYHEKTGADDMGFLLLPAQDRWTKDPFKVERDRRPDAPADQVAAVKATALEKAATPAPAEMPHPFDVPEDAPREFKAAAMEAYREKHRPAAERERAERAARDAADAARREETRQKRATEEARRRQSFQIEREERRAAARYAADEAKAKAAADKAAALPGKVQQRVDAIDALKVDKYGDSPVIRDMLKGATREELAAIGKHYGADREADDLAAGRVKLDYGRRFLADAIDDKRRQNTTAPAPADPVAAVKDAALATAANEAKTRGFGAPAHDPDPPPAPPAGPLAGMSTDDQQRIRNAVADRGPEIYASPMVGGSKSDVGRYLAEGELGKQLAGRHDWRTVWKAVSEAIDENPAALERTPAQAKAAAAARTARVDALVQEAQEALQTDKARTVGLLDKALEIDPDARLNEGSRQGHRLSEVRASVAKSLHKERQAAQEDDHGAELTARRVRNAREAGVDQVAALKAHAIEDAKDKARAAAAPAKPATTANTPDAVMADLAAALQELPGGRRKLGDTTPAAGAASLAKSLREGRSTPHSTAAMLDAMAGLSDRGNSNDVGPIITAAAARLRTMPDTPRRVPTPPAPAERRGPIAALQDAVQLGTFSREKQEQRREQIGKVSAAHARVTSAKTEAAYQAALANQAKVEREAKGKAPAAPAFDVPPPGEFYGGAVAGDERAKWPKVGSADDVAPGDVVFVTAGGAQRRGVVTGKEGSAVTVAYTTEHSPDDVKAATRPATTLRKYNPAPAADPVAAVKAAALDKAAAPSVDPAKVRADLMGSDSREAAGRYLDGLQLTAPQLRQLAAGLRIAVSGRAPKAELQREIVHWTVGRRLDSAAVSRPASTANVSDRRPAAADPVAAVKNAALAKATAAVELTIDGTETAYVPGARSTIGLADRPNVGRDTAPATQQLGLFANTSQEETQGQGALLDAMFNPADLTAGFLDAGKGGRR